MIDQTEYCIPTQQMPDRRSLFSQHIVPSPHIHLCVRWFVSNCEAQICARTHRCVQQCWINRCLQKEGATDLTSQAIWIPEEEQVNRRGDRRETLYNPNPRTGAKGDVPSRGLGLRGSRAKKINEIKRKERKRNPDAGQAMRSHYLHTY